MSYATNLAIDCGSSEQLADGLIKHFDGYVISLPDNTTVTCNTGKAERLNHWFVGVFPQGMWLGPIRGLEKEHRPELCSSPFCEVIKQTLYHHLALVSDYRRALFGCEAFDFFTSPTPDELQYIDAPDMVFAEQNFPNPILTKPTSQFCPGYRIVLT